MATVEFDVRGAGKIAAEHDKIGAAAERSAKKNAQLGQSWKTSAAEAKRYDRLAQQLIRQNETAQERYNRKLLDAKKALAGNARETELLKRETARLKDEYDKQIKKEKELHEPRTKVLKDAAEKTTAMAKATATSTENLEQHNKKFGSAAVTQIGKYAAGILSVAAAMRAVSAVIATVKENNEQAVASMERLELVNRRINQISFNAKDLKDNQATADRLAEQFGVKREDVGDLIFAARSEGIRPGTVNAILASSQTLDIKAATQVAGQLPKLFPNDRITGRQALNATLRAARESRLTFEGIGTNAPRIAEGASLAGASLAETLAVESVLADRFASGSTTADRGKAFATKVGIDERLRGKGFLRAFQTIHDDFTPEERKKFLGESQELNAFYQILGQEFYRVVGREQSISQAIRQTGTEDSELAGALRRAQSDPKFSANFANRQSQVELEIAREDAYATAEARRDAVQNRLQAEQIRGGSGAIRQALVSAVTGTLDLFNASPETIAATGIGADRLFDRVFSGKFNFSNPGSNFQATPEEQKRDSDLMQELLKQTIETNRLLENTSDGISELNDKNGLIGVSQ